MLKLLGPGEIHLWLAFYDRIDDEATLAAFRALLDPAERLQQGRFYRADDRRRYLVTRALVRTVLSRYLPVEPVDWVFTANAYGRPAASNDEAREARLSFNLSHTQGVIVLAVARDRALGVDVENVQAREVSTEIADHYFSPAEVAALHRVPLQQRQERFFEYWTFKESYIKARGMGLSIPLDRFSFDFPHEHGVRITVAPELGDTLPWQFWQLRLAPRYLIAVCAERLQGAGPAPSVQGIWPWGLGDGVTAPISRESDPSCHSSSITASTQGGTA